MLVGVFSHLLSISPSSHFPYILFFIIFLLPSTLSSTSSSSTVNIPSSSSSSSSSPSLLFCLAQSKVKKVAFLFTKSPVAEYDAIAKKLRGKFVFATSDGSIQRLNDHVGVSLDSLPQFLILVMMTRNKSNNNR